MQSLWKLKIQYFLSNGQILGNAIEEASKCDCGTFSAVIREVVSFPYYFRMLEKQTSKKKTTLSALKK